jgi:DNA polymerase (family X)
MALNERVSEALETIARMLDLLGEDSFKSAANARAARLIEDLPQDVAALAKDRASLLAIKGIGPKIADKIIEFCQTGTMAELEELRGRVPPGLMDLLEIPGLGPKTVRALWTTLDVTDVAGLERVIADGSILTVPRMGEKAVAKLKDSIALAKRAGERLWVGPAHRLAESLIARLRGHGAVEEVVPAGSMRRGRDTVGDIDLLARLRPGMDDRAAEVAALFRESPGVVQVLAAGASKSAVRIGLGADFGRWNRSLREDGEGPSVQVDLRITPASQWGAALMYFTGSKEHNIRLRERAIARGMTLSEHGLFRDDGGEGPAHLRGGAAVAGRTEEEVYAALGLAWMPPEVREDRGELERAAPWDLVTLGDIRAELHAHTTASDGRLSIEELAKEAKARGFHTIAVTDHSQSSIQANGLKPDRLRRHIEAVREAGEAVKGITILAGSEVDIHADGRLDYEDDLLAALDVVVASPHSALSQEPSAATARFLRVLAHPLVHILGHPTGRLINRRGGLSPDMGALVAAAKEHGVALEINAHWMRLDLRDAHARLAADAGCMIAIDCDVHEPEDFDNLRFGVATARRGWVPGDLCVNTWDQPRLLAWLRKGRG